MTSLAPDRRTVLLGLCGVVAAGQRCLALSLARFDVCGKWQSDRWPSRT